MNFKTVEVTLASNVADDGTFTANYPEGFNNGHFENASGLYFVINGSKLTQPDDIGIAFGTASITITNRTGSDLLSGKGFLTVFFGGEKVGDITAHAEVADNNFQDLVQINATRVEHLRVNFGAPAAADADGILDGVAANTNAQVYTAEDFKAGFEGTLEVARNVTLVGSSGANHVVTVTGKDEYGQPMSENLTANGATTVNGKKAFKEITKVNVAAGAAGDTIDLGWGDVLGLPVRIERAGDIVEELEDGAAATAGTLTAKPDDIGNKQFAAS